MEKLRIQIRIRGFMVIELYPSHLMFAANYLLAAIMAIIAIWGFPTLRAWPYLLTVVGLAVVGTLVWLALLPITAAEQPDCEFCGHERDTTAGQFVAVFINGAMLWIPLVAAVTRMWALHNGVKLW